jgi:orotate phosphoribosyltransferase
MEVFAMTNGSHRQELCRMLASWSVKRGHFVLTSGLRSDVYVDAKLTTCRAAALPLIGRCFLDKFVALGWRPSAVGGLVIGADPLAIAVARESVAACSPMDAFLVRKDPKQHGTRQFIEGLTETQGREVVILDDVCTTGGSTVLAVQRARESGLHVLGAVCLVDRQMGAHRLLEEEHRCPFDRIFTLQELLANDSESATPEVVTPAEAVR